MLLKRVRLALTRRGKLRRHEPSSWLGVAVVRGRVLWRIRAGLLEMRGVLRRRLPLQMPRKRGRLRRRLGVRRLPLKMPRKRGLRLLLLLLLRLRRLMLMLRVLRLLRRGVGLGWVGKPMMRGIRVPVGEARAR